MTNQEADIALQETAKLVLKRGVALGLLDGVSRQRALALAWQCLPHGVALTEARVNAWVQELRERSQAEALRRRSAWSERQPGATVAAGSRRRP